MRGTFYADVDPKPRITACVLILIYARRVFDQGENMNSRMIKTVLAASLMIAAGAASAQQTYYRTAQVPGQANADTYNAASMNQGAMQDQSGDASYGGASMGSTSWGNSGMNDSASSKPCTRGPQCNIFFGN
jgi:hypothetical protein